ncbi:MAG TPA: PAS domain S-box protein, partial [Terriglobales bacterium]|nr:PAS domain S-box protein [Terriglobales bacterium]
MSIPNDARQADAGELLDSRLEAEFFINAVPSILIGLDAQGRINRWNDVAAQTFGLSDSDVPGPEPGHCGIKWLTPNIESRIADFLRSESRIPVDDFRFEKNGTACLLGLSINRIKLPHKKRCELLIIGSDITEKKRAESELRAKTAFLEAQIQATLDGILVVDENARVVWHNQRFLEIFEVPPNLWNTRLDDVLLEHVLRQIADPGTFLQRVKYLYSHKHEISREEIRFHNGTVLDCYSSPVFGKDDHYYGRIWTFRDITERKKNEEALRQLSVAVEQSPVSVLITDLKGNITYVNRRFTESTGYTSQEVLGENPRFLRSGQTPTEDYQSLWGTIRRGEEWRGEPRNKKKNGELYWESMIISPIRNSAGETSHYLAMKEDITAEKLAESHVRQAQKLEAIGQLAAGIAHEINTPIQFIGDNARFIKEAWSSLNATISLLEIVPHDADSPAQLGQIRQSLKDCDYNYLRTEVPRALDQSLDGISRVAKIVQAMKEFSHPGADEKQPVDINKAILTTLTVARNEWKYVADVETFLQPD